MAELTSLNKQVLEAHAQWLREGKNDEKAREDFVELRKRFVKLWRANKWDWMNLQRTLGKAGKKGFFQQELALRGSWSRRTVLVGSNWLKKESFNFAWRKRLRVGKAAGVDNIDGEMKKYGGKHVQDATWTLIKAFENPKKRKQGVVIPLHRQEIPRTQQPTEELPSYAMQPRFLRELSWCS
ncbi:hypothetical protein QOT17_024574 [Balamuthia mandrillaris]